MNRFLVAAAFALVVAAGAAQAQTVPPDTMTLTKGQYLELDAAIKALNGHVSLDDKGNAIIVHDARGNVQAVPVPYTFADGVIKKLADDQVLLDKVEADFNAAAKARFKLASPTGKEIDPKSVDGMKLQADYDAALAETVPVPLKTVGLADLRVDANKLPASVVAGLLPIIADK